jgi:catechol 2,3-dioxygenase-like lactoylglutathione lyase family enzyme
MIFDSQITFLSTRDLDLTSSFYVNLLGLTLVLDQGTCKIYKMSSSAYLGFCLKDRLPETDGVIITLVTEDVDSYCETLRRKGVTFEKNPAFNPDYNIYHAFLRDPNGYLLEVQRFEDPRWKNSDYTDSSRESKT